MKNEKLELLLNKVVEYNQSEKVHFKGFLYKDGYGYYIKVVEAISGTDVAVNDLIRLKDGEEQYIIVADKPKLMRVSLKSWHYNLIKYVLGSYAPTPRTMQNGCPYFWLLIFSILASPFVLLWKTAVSMFMIIPKVLFWGLERLTISWMESIDDVQAYEYYWNGKYSSDTYKMPVTARLYFDKTDADFMDYFMLEKYNLDRKVSPEEYEKKRNELKAKWDAWREERKAAREKRSEERRKKEEEQERIRYELARKQAERKAKWDARMQPIENGFNALFAAIRKMFTFKGDIKLLVKRTKQVVGALVTLILLAASFFVVEGLVLALSAFIDFSISHWYIYAFLGALAIVVGILYVLFTLFTGWAQAIINKYESGKRVWYIEPFIYLVYYPLKYIVLGIAYGALYLIWTPIKFIFYNFLFKLILVPTGKFLWKVLCSLGRGIANSSGVFGEYFSASYTDYCPGIEWVDTEEQN